MPLPWAIPLVVTIWALDIGPVSFYAAPVHTELDLLDACFNAVLDEFTKELAIVAFQVAPLD